MNVETTEPDSFLRNLRLISSKWHAFVFIINPIVSWIFLLYTFLHLGPQNLLPPLQQVSIPFAYLSFMILLAYETSQKIKQRLREAGYEQKVTITGGLDILMNFGMCWVLYNWMQTSDTVESPSAWDTYLHFFAGGLVLWLILVLMCLGPILWFTVRNRSGRLAAE